MSSSLSSLDLSPNTVCFLSLFCLSIFLIDLPPAHAVSFNISTFDPNDTRVYYEGDTASFNGAIRLNRYDYLSRVGRATYVEPVQVWDSATKRLSDFSTTFSFTIDTLSSPTYGHGLIFFLAPIDSHIPLNSVGGFLGLFNTTTLLSPSQNQIVAVEFDSFVNSEWDPPAQHVGISINSLKSVAYVSWNASLHSEVMGNARIAYNASTKTLSVFLTYEENPIFGGVYNLSYQVDLRTILPERVSIGFSAATGMYVELNKIYSWEFSSNLKSRTNGTSSPQRKKKVRVKKWMVGLAVLVCVLVSGAIIASIFLWKKRSRRGIESKEVNMMITSMNSVLERGTWPRRFSHEELVAATNNFSDERKLGQGGFGDVYKGYLTDTDTFVAVKKISRGSKQGTKEYLTEVKIISCLRHRNLVTLMGWCHEQGEYLLIYEFMPNRSLDMHLFGTNTSLTWPALYKIALGLASALLYLHEEWEQCVVHRDIKSSNVMLDSGFNAKLGDFGLARLMDHELGPQTTALAGTWGYLAPEYIAKGKASKESDVYSFGVVALEICCGRKAVKNMEEEAMVRLVDWVWELYGNGRLLEAADKRLGNEFDEKQMECLMLVGLWCAHPDHTLRPSIKQAIQVLNFEAPKPTLPRKMPVPMYGVPPSESLQASLTFSSLGLGR